ncbi:MAG: hypothetical protein JJU29_02315 [Verrucomicrobia bacterium]|nr:hypothetical protein [Verrucomicrobiota bacterium]
MVSQLVLTQTLRIGGLVKHGFVPALCCLVLLTQPFRILAESGGIFQTVYLGFPAYEITDGLTRAVIVPELAGRVMFYGWMEGENLIWNASGLDATSPREGFVNWGGDKTLVGPHEIWGQYSERRWPPRPSWMSEPHMARVEDEGRSLVTEGPAWEGFALRVVRRYRYAGEGSLEITQTLEKTDETAEALAVWSVAQVNPPDQAYVLRDPGNEASEGFRYTNQRQSSMPIFRLTPGLLGVGFQPLGATKVSFDSPQTALAARWGDTLWIQRGTLREGALIADPAFQTPPVEIYHQGREEDNYVELELMSPAVRLTPNRPARFVTHWSLFKVDGKMPSVFELLQPEAFKHGATP